MSSINDVLPNEIIFHILNFTGNDKAFSSKVCTLWYDLVKPEERICLWRNISSVKQIEYIFKKYSLWYLFALNEQSVRAKLSHLHKKIISGGVIDIIQWFADKTDMINSDICYTASGYGHLHVLKWFRNIDPEKYVWNEGVIINAAKKGHEEVFLWLLANDCPFDPNMALEEAVIGGHLSIIDKCISYMSEEDRTTSVYCDTAIECGQSYSLKLLRKHSFVLPDSSSIYDYIVNEKSVEILKSMLKEEDPPYYCDEEMFYFAVNENDFDFLKWLKENFPSYCPWSTYLCKKAAKRRNLQVLKWLRSPEHKKVPAVIRENSDEKIKWRKCPWDVSIIKKCREFCSQEDLVYFGIK